MKLFECCLGPLQSFLNQQMIWEILGVIAALILYLAFRFLIKPYYRMQKFKNVKGAHFLSFIPMIGGIGHAEKSFQKHGSELRGANNTFKRWPDARIIVSNIMDKAMLIILDPALIKQFFQKQDCYHKYERIIYNERRIFGNGSSFAENKEWVKKRRIMSSIFHFQFYESFIPKMEQIIDQHIQAFKLKSVKSFEAKEFSSIISGETIIQTFFGVSFKEQIDGLPISVWLHAVVHDSLAQGMALRTIFGVKILQYGLTAQDRKMNQKIKIYQNIVKSAIEKKMGSQSEERGLFLEELWKKKLYKTEEGFDLEELAAEFSSLYVAGTDASSHHTSMCFYYLTFYPEIQERIRQEIKDSKVLEGKMIDLKVISNMKYLDYFTKEVFRHYSFMGTVTPREVVVEHQLGDLTITKDDIVLLGWAEQAYNPVYFPEPDTFDPDRWSKLNQKELTYVFAPFSVGQRNCFGQNFAMLEVKMVLCKMIAAFRLTLDPDYKLLIQTDSLPGPVNPMNIAFEEI